METDMAIFVFVVYGLTVVIVAVIAIFVVFNYNIFIVLDNPSIAHAIFLQEHFSYTHGVI